TRVMGGLQSGLVVPVPVTLKVALQFCTGNLPPALVAPLFSALGSLLPGLTQATSAVTATLIWVSSPRPATLPETVMASPLRVMVGVPTKCGLPAQAACTARAVVARASTVTSRTRRIEIPSFSGAEGR